MKCPLYELELPDEDDFDFKIILVNEDDLISEDYRWCVIKPEEE